VDEALLLSAYHFMFSTEATADQERTLLEDMAELHTINTQDSLRHAGLTRTNINSPLIF
jgi:hypothetical protein